MNVWIKSLEEISKIIQAKSGDVAQRHEQLQQEIIN